MKKTYLSSLVFVFLFGLYFCKPILLKTQGVSQPKFETSESILSYLSSFSFDAVDGVFVAKDSIQFFQLLSLIKDLPSVDFYNSKGELIKYSKKGDCTGEAEKFAASLSINTFYTVDTSYQIRNVQEKIRNIKNIDELINKEIDFIVLLYWAKYLGNMNQSIFNIARVLHENKNIKTKIYLVNMDFQREWGMKQIPEIMIK